MNIEEPEPNPTSDHILDWLDDPFLFSPTFLDDTYYPHDIDSYDLWDQNPDSTIADATTLNNIGSGDPFDISTQQVPSVSLNKRKASDDPFALTSQDEQMMESESNQLDDQVGTSFQEAMTVSTSLVSKKSTAKANKAATGDSNNDDNKGRWAEQLLNPCAAAIASGNLTRAQHLLYVLQELASATGDANNRLAAHGLKELTRHLSPPLVSASSALDIPVTFASTEPRWFQQYLLKFNEVNPWFAFPSNIANSAILQLLDEEANSSCTLHIVDIGVSHGLQWPTLIEALAHRPGGPPRLVRITVVSATKEKCPFSVGPAGDNSSSRLLSFAKSMTINLHIDVLENYPLQNLNAQMLKASKDDILVVCAQFRLHQLSHHDPDERTEFLKVLRSLEPNGVILSENNMECSCMYCGDFGTVFARRVELLWKILDSTSSAFKGKECEERRMMEGEAATALSNNAEVNNDRMEKWCERIRMAGFAGRAFEEDAIDVARALLRKYDSDWEMRVEENDGCISLWWKGQPVSFSSLWKVDRKMNHF